LGRVTILGNRRSIRLSYGTGAIAFGKRHLGPHLPEPTTDR
jgi:hypothetical protein